MSERMPSQNKAVAFVKNELEVPEDFTSKDREFVALMLKNHCDLDRTAADLRISYHAARRRLKDPGVARLLGSVYSEFEELAKHALPRVFRQTMVNATFDPRALIKAAEGEREEFFAALDALHPQDAAAIQEVGWTKSGKPVLKFANRNQALDLALRFFDNQRAAVRDTGKEALGIQVILRAPDGSTTEVRALATPEAPQANVEADI